MTMKTFRYLCEYGLLRSLFALFALLPPETASNIGGWIGRAVGLRLGATKKAMANLRAALPDLGEDDYKTIIGQMWDNLGRVIAEYPHLRRIVSERTEIVGSEHLRAMRDDGLPGLMFAAHLANWEVTAIAGQKEDLAVDGVLRIPNNPYVADLLARTRTQGGLTGAIPKGRGSGRQLIKTLMEGGHIGILIDQKYNEGIPALFFGRPAMTSPAFVELAQKFRCPLAPVRCERLGGARFRITMHEPLKLFDEENNPLPVEIVIAQAHALLEDWIRQRPGQWLWLHRRWSSRAETEYRGKPELP